MFCGKKSFGGKAGLAAEEFFVEIADARLAGGLDIELEITARLVEGNQHPGFDPLPVGEAPAEQRGAIAVHHAAYLCLGVLEGEVDVP